MEGISTLAEIRDLTKLSNTTIFRLVQNGQFPKFLRPLAARSYWRATEVEEWLRVHTNGGGDANDR
ncbi:AlpA family phage regulatory protein [Hyphomicrobiales bacterium]|uniref:helix-turn-helix transcriptional regulator n=1 Tax=Rhizobium leguminosarum TaxID=384 RepID=UPI0013B041B9